MSDHAADLDYDGAKAETKQTAGMINRSREKAYKFKQIFSDEPTKTLFEQSVLEEIDNALQGLNSCVFAFGATGSGKTFTMFGGGSEAAPEPGIIEYAMRVDLGD